MSQQAERWQLRSPLPRSRSLEATGTPPAGMETLRGAKLQWETVGPALGGEEGDGGFAPTLSDPPC